MTTHAARLVLLVAACTPTPATRKPAPHRPSIAVLGLEPIGTGAEPAAQQLTDALRSEAALAGSRFTVTREARGLVELKELASCRNDAPACMASIGAFLEVDYMLYGKLERRPTGDVLSLDLMDVAKRINRRAVTIPVGGNASTTAHDAYAKLGGTRAPEHITE